MFFYMNITRRYMMIVAATEDVVVTFIIGIT
jgi:hypothetical protein